MKIGELEQDKIDIEKRAIAEKEALNAEKEEIREQCKKAIFENSKACEDKINGINEDHAKKERSLREEISSVNSERKKEKDAFAAELSALNARAEESREVNLALNARLHAYQWKNKDLPNEDLTERENFKQLEAEREWFAKMFKENWAKTKKRIRDEVFSGAFEPAEKEDIEEPLPDTESEFMLDTEESEIEKAEDTAQENEAVIK